MNDELDLNAICAPKSDQLNSDDLIACSKTIKIVSVHAGNAEQKLVIRFEGDNGKPWKPCKSMTRVMCVVWGTKASDWVGKVAVLYNDPTVRFGGVEVGGIRISHVSGITSPITIALTAKRGAKKPFQVKPYVAEQKKTLNDPTKLLEASAAHNWTIDKTIENAEVHYFVTEEMKIFIAEKVSERESANVNE